MVENPSISIIIPCYNTQEYIKECINSTLFNQTLQNIEVIIINDGSTDSSGRIINEYAQKDNRIVAFHQHNQGLSASRNQGLKMAKGEYVLFLDSDDWLKEDCLIKFYDAVKVYHFDMVMGVTLFYYASNKIIQRYNIPNQLLGMPINGHQCFVELMKFNSFVPMACNYLYKRKWLERINMLFIDVMHEDELWTPMAMCQAQKVLIQNLPFYYYRQRDNSIMSSMLVSDQQLEKRTISLFKLCEELILFGERIDVKDSLEFKSWLYVKISELAYYAFESLVSIKNSFFIPPVFNLSSLISAKKWLHHSTKGLFLYYCKRVYSKVQEYNQQMGAK